MAHFPISYTRTKKYEGLYSINKLDKGAETYKGISRRWWPKWDGWQIIDIFKAKYPLQADFLMKLEGNTGLQEMVVAHYQRNFFDELMLWSVDQDVADELFDTAVNQGTEKASKDFQESLNILNRNQKDYKDLKVDGSVGMKTLNAYDKLMHTTWWKSRNEEKIRNRLVKWINFHQMLTYKKADGTDQEFWVHGWTDRV